MLDRKGSKSFHGAPKEVTYRAIVGVGLVGSELLTKVSERVEAAGIVEELLILPVAALDLAIVPGGIGTKSLWRMPRAAAVASKSV